MTYNELIDALLEIATKGAILVAGSDNLPEGKMVISRTHFYALSDALGTLEALPFPPQDPKPGHERAVEFIRDFRAERDKRKAAEKSAMEWMCTGCRMVYPGPPQRGFNCVICTHCGGITAPRLDSELREANIEVENLKQQLAGQHGVLEIEKANRRRAERALRAAGYEDHSGEEWAPPLGKKPTPHPLEHRVRDLETRLNDLASWREVVSRNLLELNSAPTVKATDDAGNTMELVRIKGGMRPAAPRSAPPPAKQPCADCGGAFHKYTECPPFAGVPADVALQETTSVAVMVGMPPAGEKPIKLSIGAEVHNADKNDQVDHGLRQRMFDKLAWIKVGGDTASAKFLIKYVGGSDKLVDVPADKWQIMIDACDEYMRVRGGHA